MSKRYLVALIVLVFVPGLLLPSSGSAFAHHDEPHEPDIIVTGVRPCPDGYICLTGDAAREFRRQLEELAAQAALLAGLAVELPQAPENEEHRLSCDGLKANFEKLLDACMVRADLSWSDCKKSYAGSVGTAAWEFFMEICDDRKKKNEQTCRDDDATRQGLLAGLCNNNGGDLQ